MMLRRRQAIGRSLNSGGLSELVIHREVEISATDSAVRHLRNIFS